MSILRASLSALLCTTLALPTSVAWAGPPPPPPPGGNGVQPEAPPDPSTLSQEERLTWAKKLFGEAKAAHDREDYYNSVIRFEQAYAFAPDKHIFAFNIGQDAWELKDCARVKQYLELFLVKEQNNADLRKKAQDLLQKSENNPECVTGGPAAATTPTTTNNNTSSRPATDEEDPLLQKRKSGGSSSAEEDDAPKKRGVSGLFIGGVVLAVLGVGAVGGGIGTLVGAKNRASGIEEAAAPGSVITTFPQGQYTSDVDDDFNSLKTLNLVTPILIAAGGALLVGGIAMIAVDRTNKKKGKGFYAGKKRLEVTGLGAAPLPGGGAAGSFALRF
ncbi:hypothetical protein SAMN02745121_03725 [Nannocystis exedens]|uniref:Tetratricopeptide repeat-containing protein n=1 Tax=Nannocystis exedens TaxID=54 RepID=A0A1I1ZBT8_9BACT|nr:hypothetical protein [Nannocystis exedens]SFE28798.1 hypothetical protein SAMN02745121_03725 [Nannocystis exedens]